MSEEASAFLPGCVTSITAPVQDVACGSAHTLLLVQGGTGASMLLGCGWNKYGQLGKRLCGTEEDVPVPRSIILGAEGREDGADSGKIDILEGRFISSVYCGPDSWHSIVGIS